MKNIIKTTRTTFTNTSLSHILFHFAVFAAVILSVSCGRSSAGRSLAVADSLTEADQRAAITYIDSIVSQPQGNLPRSDRMKLALLRAKAMNKLVLPLNRDSLLMLSDYFADHGTPNEQMLATYILGCSFVVNKDAPTALKYFHEAAAMADTTAEDCDWRTLHKVHGQAGMLLFSQDALHDADDEYKLAFKYAMKAKDTLNALITVEQKANIYMLEGKTDSCIRLRTKLHNLYLKHGYAENAAMSLGPVIDNLAEMGKFDEAKRYLDNFEKNSGLFDSLGNIERGREIHYYIKGMYYLEVGQTDSAEYLFRKCIHSTKRLSTIQPAYEGLMRLYKKLHRPDSVAKYAEFVNALHDSVYNKGVMQHLQQMQAMYNYEQHERRAEEAEEETADAKNIGILVATILLLMFSFAIIYIIRRRKLQISEKQKYEDSISELENEKHELETLGKTQREEMEALIEEKTKEIEELSRERQGFLKPTYMNQKQLMFKDESIVKQISEHLKKDFKCMTLKECAGLKSLFSDYAPVSQLKRKLNDNEYILCLLIKTGFSPKDIAVLMGLSLPNVSNMRKRIFKKIMGREGSAKDLNNIIMGL